MPDYKKDITSEECCIITCLPFWLLYRGVKRCMFVSYRAFREATQARECQKIIKSQKLSNAIYKRFYLHWRDEDTPNTYIIIKVRPPCLLDAERESISSLINKLWLRSCVTQTHFVLKYVNHTNDITWKVIQSLKAVAKNLTDRQQDTIAVMDDLYDGIWQEQIVDKQSNACLIRDVFTIVRYQGEGA